MRNENKLSSVERLKNLSKMLADEEIEVVDSPAAIRTTRGILLGVLHIYEPEALEGEESLDTSRSSRKFKIAGLWNLLKGKI